VGRRRSARGASVAVAGSGKELSSPKREPLMDMKAEGRKQKAEVRTTKGAMHF
jgi:hypothetical protein